MGDRSEGRITGKDKLIVMPVQPADGKAPGPGLGLHFLQGNLVCLHPGLLECWFGWRVKKIFDGAEAMKRYCRGHGPFPDIRDLGEKEKVRFWLEGRYVFDNQEIAADLVLHDTREGLGALAGLMWCAVEAKDKAAALHYALEKARCRGGDPDKARAFVEKKFS